MHASTKRISLVDLARQLCLSPSTVSRALAGHRDVNLATQARVRRLAEQLNYLPNSLAASLRRGRSRTLGLVVPHINGYFFPAVMAGIERVASAAGYNVVMCQSNEDVRRERCNISTLLAAQVEGIMLSVSATTRADTDHLEQVRQQGTPLVFFDRVPALPQSTAVVLDDFAGAYQAVAHLMEQGCYRIAHFAGPRYLNTSCNRLLGYQQALRAHGLPAPPEWVYPLAAATLAEGWAGMCQLLAHPGPAPDALFLAYAYPAAGALEELQARDLRVPQQLALACFSNEPFTDLSQLNLTVVDQHAGQMGEATVRLLLQVLKYGADYRPSHLVLVPELHVRASSQRLGPAAVAVRAAAKGPPTPTYSLPG